MILDNIAETVGIIRDFILILASLLLSLIILFLYRKLASVLDSAGRVLKNAEELSETISTRFEGTSTVGGRVASGALKTMSFILGLTRRSSKKGGTGDGGQ